MDHTVTIRRSKPGDATAIGRIAALDSGRAPAGEALLAFEGGELRAVLPLDVGRPLADPFHPTADLVELLRMAAARDHRTAAPRRRRARLLARPALLRARTALR
jgi:hypothetical protein